ncbi:MAG: two-component system NtrC family sensor kinase [Polyangiales bacterium]
MVSLTISEARGKTASRTRIVDDGCGMSNEVLRKVFDPFFTTKDVGMGTGLGLAVSLGIVEEHGGWFEVQSEPDGGTQTDLFLPLSLHTQRK